MNARLGQRTTLLCNDAYAVVASGVTHGAIWSAERPTADCVAAARDAVRESIFYPDSRLPPADQAQLEDYRRCGFDRGHMTPSGDMPNWEAQQQSFSLANMVPQTAQLNRGIWARIETAVRDLATREGELYVVTGPAFEGEELKSIGPNAVLVPSATWKAVYSPEEHGAGVYMCANTTRPGCDLTRDKQGLVHALILKALLDQSVQSLQADKNLPDAAPAAIAPKGVPNPFK